MTEAEQLEMAVDALKKISVDWKAHTSRMSLLAYASQYAKDNHGKAGGCGGGEVACSCGVIQTMAVHVAGRKAVDEALKALGWHLSSGKGGRGWVKSETP